MAELQRSEQTFRRSGSSGLVWDERFLSGEPSQAADQGGGGGMLGEVRRSQSVGSSSVTTGERRRRNDDGGGGGRQGFRAETVPPAVDPPSPDVRGCVLCGILGMPKSYSAARRSKPTRRG